MFLLRQPLASAASKRRLAVGQQEGEDFLRHDHLLQSGDPEFQSPETELLEEISILSECESMSRFQGRRFA
jgi:hypothetical protein